MLKNFLYLSIRDIREIKTVLCYDACGKKSGDEIRDRVDRKLAKVDTVLPVIDHSDAQGQWWSLPWWSMSEDKEVVQQRVRDFLAFVRSCEGTPIFVGHSQFFKAFYSTRISENFQGDPETSANMKKYRLGNATVLAVEVSFENNEKVAEIINAEVLFADSSPQWL